MNCVTTAILSLALFIAAISAGDIQTRIVGGQVTQVEQHPYQVSLRKGGEHFCGGSIISEKHILTAAHCIHGIVAYPYTDFTVHSGTSYSTQPGKSHGVAGVKVHPGYVPSAKMSYHNDIAIVTLKDPIKFDGSQQKIKLASHDVVGGESAMITGWGELRYEDPAGTPNQLYQISMKLVSVSQCQQYMQQNRLHKEQICAFNRPGVGACRGDSGGPLVSNGEVVGIASWVIPCGEGYPDVYTKVYAYRDFIKQAMSSAPQAPPAGGQPQIPQSPFPQLPQNPFPQWPQNPFPQLPQNPYPQLPQNPYPQLPQSPFPGYPYPGLPQQDPFQGYPLFQG